MKHDTIDAHKIRAASVQRTRSIVKAVSLVTAILASTMFAISLTSAQKPPLSVAGLACALVLVQLLAYSIASHGENIKLAAWILTLSLLAAFTVVTAIMGGIHAPIILAIMVAPMCGALVLEYKESLVILVLSVVVILGFIVCEKTGISFADSGLDQSQRAVRSAIWEILCICMCFVTLARYDKYNHQFTIDLSEQAATDKMTGFYSKDVAETLLFQQVQVSQRSNQPLSVMIIDIDYFKQINDQLGHKEGDRYIECIADLIRQEIRRSADVIGRIGGDEFMILLPQTPLEGAKRVAEQIRCRVSTIPLPRPVANQVHLSLSIGVATYSGCLGFGHEDVFKAADQSLYRSKQLGRDQVSCQIIGNHDKAVLEAVA